MKADPIDAARYINELEGRLDRLGEIPTSRESFEFQGHHYGFTLASDVADRDGMGLELEQLDVNNRILMEIFYSDQDGSFTVDLYERLPLELVERSVAVAKRFLPPGGDR